MLRKALKPLNRLVNSITDQSEKSGSSLQEDVADTWCPLPWLGMGVRTVGDLRYCCHAQSSPDKGLLRGDNNQVLNLETDSLQSGTNASLLKEVRKDMLQGKKHSGCVRCYREEDAGIFSRRQSEQWTWAEHNIDLFRRYTEEDGSISSDFFPIRYLDLRFGNRCNLKCRMCGPTESDKWYELTPKVWDGVTEFEDGNRKLKITKNNNGQYGLEVDPYQWYESDKFWRELEEHLPRLQRIYLAGGEPLLIEAQFDFLQKCIDLGYATNITLEYNSNITALTPKILKIWSRFRKVEVGMSIDGVGKINDYIRVGSDWKKIEKNLHTLDQADGHYKLWWACTIQVYNVLQLPDIMKWIMKNNFNRINQSKKGREIFTPHPLANPIFLSVTTFPQSSKCKIREIFEGEKEKIFDEVDSYKLYDSEQSDFKDRVIQRFSKVLDNYTNIMFAKDTSEYQDKFWKYTKRLDEIHGTSLREVSPLTFELMSKGPKRGL